MSAGAGLDQPANHTPLILNIGGVTMTVAVKATESASAVTYQYVVAIAVSDKSVSIIQDTGTERTTRTFDRGYSVTIT